MDAERTDMPHFGELLHCARAAAALTQEELAERAGLSVRGISDLERGVKSRPHKDTVRLLATALALTGATREAFEAARGRGVGTDPQQALATTPTNLPLALTSFVGRERALATARQLLGQTRLLTLTGTGGCGKTRLALEVARALAREAAGARTYVDGIWLVELAAVSDGALVPQTVATALGVREKSGQSLVASLTAFLQPKHLLLLLDNCEHLVVACAELVDALLRVCPQVTILATSRQALGISGERPWRVPSLSLPDPGQPLTPDQALESEAVQLFVQRAQVVHREFAPTGQQVELVAHVCRRLDGIPLALELAAARLSAIALDQLSTRLDDRFRLLTGGSRTALPRQQTLRATLDWSYDLLDEPERILLCRLSVFAGGWTLEAAEVICAGEGIAPEEVLDLLAGLVDQSLVLLEEERTGARYRLLETVRQYGRERLEATGDVALLQDCHLDWYLALARQAEPQIGGPEQAAWLARLERELENLRAALTWSTMAQDRQETGLRLAEALRWFWVMHRHLSEGRRWLEALLKRDSAAVLRARSLDALGELVWQEGHSERALALFEESFVLHSAAGNSASAAHALLAQGMVTTSLGDYPRATALIEAALPLLRAQGERHGVGWSLSGLGVIRHLQGDYSGAAAFYEESLALFQTLGDTSGGGYQLAHLANVARDLSDHARAIYLYRESLGMHRVLRDAVGVAHCFEGLAVVAVAAGQPSRAACLLGAAHSLRAAIGKPAGLITNPDRTAAAVRATLGEDAFAATWAAGQALKLEEAVALALEMDPAG